MAKARNGFTKPARNKENQKKDQKRVIKNMEILKNFKK